MKAKALPKFSKLAALFFFTCLFSKYAFATVVYTNDNRAVQERWDTPHVGSTFILTEPDSPFADFDTIGQVSSLADNGFSAFGSGFAYEDSLSSHSRSSIFDISFSLTTNSLISLSGMLSGSVTTFSSGTGQALITIYSGTQISSSDILFNDIISVFNGSEDKLFSFNDSLASGEYRIIVNTSNSVGSLNATASSSYNLEASFTPVPIPATVWLFISGLLGMYKITHRNNI